MTTSERIETNADLLLWCVHILGPDDVYAAPCHSAAVIHARELNKTIHRKSRDLETILCFAYAAPWSYSKDAHAEEVKKWISPAPPLQRLEG